MGRVYSVLTVTNIRVLSLSVDYNQITWGVADTTHDMLDYTFQVLRSESVAGPFEELSAPFSDHFIFIDNALPKGNVNRQHHYTIRVVNRKSGEQVDFGPATRAPEPTLIAMELQKHLGLLMSEYIGRRCWLLPVRTFGQRCISCWNPRLQQRRKSGCRTCFDTGFTRGYYSPIEIWVSIDPDPSNQQPTNLGLLQQRNTTARTGHFPPIKPGDVIVEPENARWRVTAVTSTQEQRVVVTQELQLHGIPTSDAEYAIPIDTGKPLEDLFFTPQRNFTNPQQLATPKEPFFDFPSVYQLYGGLFRGSV